MDVYFIVMVVILLMCFVFYNLVYKLFIMLYYNSMKIGVMEFIDGFYDVSELGLKMDVIEILFIIIGDLELINFVKFVSYWYVWG